jgi:hypothetical protein
MTQTWFRLQHHSRTETILDPATWESTSWSDIDSDTRRGVSVCTDLDDLVDYFAECECDYGPEYIDRLVVIELEGSLSEDDDFDADRGAYLIYPSRIVSVQPVPDELRAVVAHQDEEVEV